MKPTWRLTGRLPPPGAAAAGWQRALSSSAAVQQQYANVLTEIVRPEDKEEAEKPGSAVGLVRINRPKALNALNTTTMHEIVAALKHFDHDKDVGAMVLTGSERAFAAGADIKEMQGETFPSMHASDFFAGWEGVKAVRKPVIAAVGGYALGGGCELAMMCDIAVAGDNAVFGQPELALGVIPGMGATHRLTRLVGRVNAMDIILTGERLSASDALRLGLVSRVVPADKLLATALDIGLKIASFSGPSVAMAKESINAADQMNLREGVRFERRLFHACFALEDQKEGMAAFVEKRPPKFKNR
eukprot:jgi/Chlat1/4560/Chrsp29S04464